MAKAMKFADLETKSREDLVALYDSNTENRVIGLDFIREEIFRRDANEANDRMLSLTRKITWLTTVMTVLTIGNVVVVLVALCNS